MKIIPKQIVAGMGLAGLNISQLATLAGINRNTLGNILSEQTDPNDETLSQIKASIEQKGVEFIGTTGVQLIQHQMRTLAGIEGLKSFFNDVRLTMQNNTREIVICGIDEEYLEKKLGDFVFFQRDEMAKIANLKMRCLIEENDFDLGASHYCKYRWQAKENFSNVPFYIYGDKLAIIVSAAPEDPLILLIQNKIVSEAYRKQFDAMWTIAKEPIAKNNVS